MEEDDVRSGDAPDPRTDIADLFVIGTPGDGDRSVLVLNINSCASAPEARFDLWACCPTCSGTTRLLRAATPNGRRLADDVADPTIAMLSIGRVTGDGVGPHTDLLDEFPYRGVPHARRV